jgi:hypothetical protein
MDVEPAWSRRRTKGQTMITTLGLAMLGIALAITAVLYGLHQAMRDRP